MDFILFIQFQFIFIIMNNINSLIYIFLIEEGKIILIMISVILNRLKMIIIVISYISLTNNLEKWYRTVKINCLHWISKIIQWTIIIIMISNIDISSEFQIYTQNLFKEDKLSNLYFNEIYILLMKKYFRYKFELFRYLYLSISWIFLMTIFPLNMKYWFEDKLILMNPISIYIHEIINRINAWYSMIKVLENKVIEKGMKLMNDIMKDLMIE